MFATGIQKQVARLIALGSGLTTIFVVSGSVTDPVNTPKLLIMGVFSAAVFGLILVSGVKEVFQESKLLWILSALFLFSSIVSVVFSESPLGQGFYGTYGRNNGLLAYIFLVVLLIATAALKTHESLRKIVIWLLIAGVVNVIYCAWVILFGDFVGWENPYGNILGTLGNPNFIGAFLGIFIAAFVGYSLGNSSSSWLKYLAIFVVPVTAFAIYDSNAIQGRVVGLSGLAIIGFFILRSRFSNIVTSLYVFMVLAFGILGLLGALQIGPLAAVIYKTSVSLRGQYWLAGWNTGENHPLTGVGMDAFGDWYRRSRDAHALEVPGVNTIVNAAHNVPIDMFAFGGWPLFVTYLLIMGLGGVALVRSILRSKEYDPILVVLTTSWFGYQLQSIISINQIGLAIWGWVLTGAAIAYERMNKKEGNSNNAPPQKIMSKKNFENNENVQPRAILVSAATGIIGLLLALPPFTADSNWRSAQVSRTVQSLESTMKYSYFNPQNTNKYIINIQTLQQSNLDELAHKYALQAVEWNPESFELWKVLYYVKNSTESEKQAAIKNMKRLDPLNPDVVSIK